IATWSVLSAGAAVRHAAPEAVLEGSAVVLSPDTMREMVAQAETMPSHPVSYADRIRPITASDPAFVVDMPDGARVERTHEQVPQDAAETRSEHGIDYESSTFSRAQHGPLAEAEFLAWSTAGAATVVADGPDLVALLQDEEVT